MTGKCPHGFASSQGTRQTNNVSKHKREEGREREQGGGGKKSVNIKTISDIHLFAKILGRWTEL